ncbi:MULTISPECIES: hypothetical protein [unclassified Herbaspirillum]|uniref:hypothetical protein n=1 Tax=unclassified Herbaspirillum TaxID=2624150 RepID=UPI000E2F2945|nr:MULTISPECIES: hypothetical protein [unclassified Herbaspirillum]RFB73842.1 hypothetical protein DZB54_06100 [Herbaspirillum sp. 3R-3a1]TFI10347.1 hypothetical protein E4P32_02075 [Herbaspirillum sp. 3R11]TFI16251.1 hypothetical protein E4P31_02080 [Herbaspirillum sp. 3R-11]TFI28348.1 hypothetical protein E4P30_08145 [Herbaspirillum sp. 3C11]
MKRVQPSVSTPAAAMTIHALSDALDAGATRSALLLRNESNSLANVIARMESKGYEVSAPVRAVQAPRLPGSTAWQITVTLPLHASAVSASGALLFYVPESNSRSAT